jgi:hypothetical protein
MLVVFAVPQTNHSLLRYSSGSEINNYVSTITLGTTGFAAPLERLGTQLQWPQYVISK